MRPSKLQLPDTTHSGKPELPAPGSQAGAWEPANVSRRPERPLVERLGLGVLTLGAIELGQVVEA